MSNSYSQILPDMNIKELSISLIIPAYNEANHIETVLSRLPDFKEVIIVDDGSQDNTGDICRNLGYTVITHQINQGKARACVTGASHASGDWCFFLDADGQLYPEDLLKLVPFCSDNDLIITQRSGKDIPPVRRMANFLMAASINVLYGTRFTDVQCGLRGIRRELLLKMELTASRYQFEIEVLMKALESKQRIAAIPIDVSYTVGSRMPFRSALNITRWFLGYAARRIRHKLFP
jgi:glycosyltransferase involved in cell wall biosynthesis